MESTPLAADRQHWRGLVCRVALAFAASQGNRPPADWRSVVPPVYAAVPSEAGALVLFLWASGWFLPSLCRNVHVNCDRRAVIRVSAPPDPPNFAQDRRVAAVADADRRRHTLDRRSVQSRVSRRR